MTSAWKLGIIATFAAGSMLGGDFLPIEQGNTWTYKEASTGQTFTMRVGTPVFVGDQVYYSLIGYAPKTVLVRLNESKNLVYFEEETRKELVLTLFEPFELGWWEAPLRTCDQEAKTHERRGSHEGPAGPLQDVLEIQYRTFSCADAGIDTEQYAENIGMVRRVEQSIAGPRQYDLVYARVGHVVIDTSRSGRFTVSVDTSGTSNSVLVTMRLETNPLVPLALTFPSGQEYNVVIRDSRGNVLWNWAADKAFPQVVHDLAVFGMWTATVEAPRSALPPDGQGFVTAWLTTVSTSPQFSATAPLTPQVSPARGAGVTTQQQQPRSRTR